MIDFSKPLQTVSGLPVRYLGVLNEGTSKETHVISICLPTDNRERLFEVKKAGDYWIACNVGYRYSHLTIVNVPKKHVYWVNFYSDDYCVEHFTKEEADNCASNDRIACVRVEFSEGDGLIDSIKEKEE